MLAADPSFMDELAAIANRHGMLSWDGFDETDPYVLDGSSFGVSLTAEGGASMDAYGYMVFPEGYDDALAEVSALFMGAYETAGFSCE